MDREALEGILGDPDEDGVWTLTKPLSSEEDADPDGLDHDLSDSSSGPDFSNVTSLPNVPTPLTVAPMPALSDSEASVFALVGDAPVRTGYIEHHAGLSRRQMNRVLTKLSSYGLIHQPDHGWWQAGNGNHDTTDQQEATG